MKQYFLLVTLALAPLTLLPAAPAAKAASPQRVDLSARASVIDPRAKEHPEIGFVFTDKKGKPADLEHACVDTSVKPQGKLVIWLMGHNQSLFERLSGYGLHAIQVHYANGWFGQFGKLPTPPDGELLGKIRLEAATGEDFSPLVTIPQPDGIKERAFQFVKWLAKENPAGHWEQFISADGKGLRWEKVILSGISHGSTTAARFAKHQKVDRVVMLSGPRDNTESWQALPSATPVNCYFGFTHVLDGGWTGHHYDRSWELLGMAQCGPVVDVDQVKPPFGNSRRLTTNAEVKKDPNRAHGAAAPGGSAVKDASGKFIHEDVWRYLYTSPVEAVGKPEVVDLKKWNVAQKAGK